MHLQKLVDHLGHADCTKALEELASLRAESEHPDDAARRAITEGLATGTKLIRSALEAKKLSAAQVFSLAEQYAKFPFPVGTFDLAYAECLASLEAPDYAKFLQNLEKLGGFQADWASHPAEVQGLIDQVKQSTEKNSAELKKLLGNLSNHKSGTATKDLVQDLIAHSVNGLVDLEWETLLTAEQVQPFLAYAKMARGNDKASVRTRACLAECLLRQKADKLLDKEPVVVSEARALVPRTIDAADAYLKFVAGLVLQAEGHTTGAADAYCTAVVPEHPTWLKEGRRAVVLEACYEAARLTWSPGKGDEPAKRAVTYYKGAADLDENMDIDRLVLFVEAAHEARSLGEFGKQLRKLVGKKEFRTRPPSDLRLIARGYADFADDSTSTDSVLLRRVGPALEVVENQEKNGEALDFWVGRYRWELKDEKKALQAFGRALGQSKPTKMMDRGGRCGQIGELIGRLTENTPEATKHWLDVLGASIPEDVDKRGARHWELMAHKCNLLTQRESLRSQLVDDLKQKSPRVLGDLQSVIENNDERPGIQVEAHFALLLGLANAAADKKFVEDHWMRYSPTIRKHYQELGVLLKRPDIYKEYLNENREENVHKLIAKLKTMDEKALADEIQENLDQFKRRSSTPPRGRQPGPHSLDRPGSAEAIASGR
jgi:hypothetical protein